MGLKCNKCGGVVIKSVHAVYRSDGSQSGTYHCQNCGRVRNWRTEGRGAEIINMEEGERR